MITLRPLNPASADAEAAEALNRRAFPANEYVPMAHMFEALQEGGMDVLGVYEEERFAGFLVMRRLQRMAYVCFFAVMEAARCRGVGSRALQLLADYYPGCQIVVDFEAPDPQAGNNAQRLRRRRFYLRSGLKPTGWYAYYSDTEFEIVCSEEAFDQPCFQAMFDMIHARYPDFDPRVYRKET